MKKIINKDNFIIALSGILFLIFFADSTSPLYEFHYSSLDQGFFIIMGRALNSGKHLYRDFFDIKGPLFFWLQALGQKLWDGKTGAFILEAFSMVVSVITIRLILDEFSLKRWQNISIYLLFYYIMGSILWNGDTIEEFSLPVILLCLYFSILYFKYKKQNPVFPLFFGISFGLCLFSKVTVFAPVASVILVVLIDLIRNKYYKYLIKSILFFIFGAAVISVPVILYFYYFEKNLDGMLLWVFKFAFLRAGSVSDYMSTLVEQGADLLSFKYWELFVSPCYIGILYALVCIFRLGKKNSFNYLILLMSIADCLSLHLGSRFNYYLIINVPLIILIAISVFEKLNLHSDHDEPVESKKLSGKVLLYSIVPALILLSHSILFVSSVSEMLTQIDNPADYIVWNELKDIRECIPDEDCNDIFCGDYGIAFFNAMKLIPANDFPFNASYFYTIYPPAGSFITDIRRGKTKWVIQQNFKTEESIIPIIREQYEDIYTGDYFTLFKRKE